MLLTRSSRRDYMTSHADIYFRRLVETCTPKWLDKCSIEAMHSWMIYTKFSARMTIWIQRAYAKMDSKSARISWIHFIEVRNVTKQTTLDTYERMRARAHTCTHAHAQTHMYLIQLAERLIKFAIKRKISLHHPIIFLLLICSSWFTLCHLSYSLLFNVFRLLFFCYEI